MNRNEEPLKGLYIQVPAELQADFDSEDANIEAVITNEGLLLKHEHKNTKLQLPMFGIFASSIVFVITLFYSFRDYVQIPLTGSFSIASIAIVVGIITGMISFTVVFFKAKKDFGALNASKIPWRNYPVVLFSHAVMITLILLLIFRVIGELFRGVSFDHFTASLIGSLIVGTLNFFMIYLAQNLTPRTLINTLIFIILGGVSVAMLTNSEHQWWLYNLSFLGTPEATNAWQFNATLIVSALLMIALIDFMFVSIYELFGKTNKLRVLKLLLVMTAICLGGVGFFPYNSSSFSQQMHNRVAGYLVYLFIILIVLIRWLLPVVRKDFLRLSYIVGAMLIVSVYLFQGIHYLSLTAFEIVAFVLAFSWLLLLLKILIDMVQNHGKTHILRVVKID